MRTSRALGVVWLAAAAFAQQQPVELTSEPSHHLVLENEYVRVFDVIVAPKATTLIHRHNNDYAFVTLGDADLINARVGEKPVPLQLRDGEVRFTPGHFAHAAINESTQPFHNTTIELLKASTHVANCSEGCSEPLACAADQKSNCPSVVRRISSDQWTMSLVTMPPSSRMEQQAHSLPHLVVAVTDLNLTSESSPSATIQRAPGGLAWVPGGVTHSLANPGPRAAQFVTLEFKAGRP